MLMVVACITIILFVFIQPTWAASRVVRYSDYGAVGDGVADDFDAIINAHAAANEAGLAVRADAGATYYIGAANKTALLQTDTDWGDATFIIDDSKLDLESRHHHVFNVSSKWPPVHITTVRTLAKNQATLDLSLPRDSFVVVIDNTTKRYIRYGLNQDSGTAQTDVFVVDRSGNVDMKTPILWDFHNITSMTAYPIDAETRRIRGGRFTTIANQAESRYNYYARGIGITRSNVLVDGVYHAVTGERDHGAPYYSFVAISDCSNVTVQNGRFSGHKTYTTIGSAHEPVQMGSYDLGVNRSAHVTFKDCTQINDIHDPALWGIFCSDYSKNITFDHVTFSRFDAHMGVANATIRNSVLGHQGISIIGSGVLLVENTRVHGWTFIHLRGDYGSTFEGEFIIRNCHYIPHNGAPSDAVLIHGYNSGRHDFGYTCHMPRTITIDGLVIHDANPPGDYRGPKIFSDFNHEHTSEAYVETYPYVITKGIEIKNLTSQSGLPCHISDNPFMFRTITVTKKE